MNKKEFLENEIARRNRLFKGKTAAQKRVLIAKDVIAQIVAKKFKATFGTYIHITNVLYCGDIKSAQTQLLHTNSVCKCCAIGSVLASCILFNNKVDVESANNLHMNGDRYSDFEKTHPLRTSGLHSVFSMKQLLLMEAIFERHSENDICDNHEISFDKVCEIYDRWNYDANLLTDPTKRLIAIMKNIIRNKGRFIP